MGATENFFGSEKAAMFYGEQFEHVNGFIQALDNYIYFNNNERISQNQKACVHCSTKRMP